MDHAVESPSDRFAAFQRGNVSGFASRADLDALVPALLDRAACRAVDAIGRGAIFAFPIRDGEGVLREYRRGGVVGRFVREGALTNRPLSEWTIVTRLFDAGFPVPEPLGVVWRRRGPVYTGAIASRRIGSVDLIEYLRTTQGDSEQLLETVGRNIRAMHELCVYHADLHAGNILVATGAAPVHPVYFVDFDNARLTGALPADRARNLLRLRRSFVKHGLRLTDYERILRGYGPFHIPGWLEAGYAFKGALSDAIGRRPGAHAV